MKHQTTNNITIWDDRDIALGLRDHLAKIVALKNSGYEDAEPNNKDYRVADLCGALIEVESRM